MAARYTASPRRPPQRLSHFLTVHARTFVPNIQIDACEQYAFLRESIYPVSRHSLPSASASDSGVGPNRKPLPLTVNVDRVSAAFARSLSARRVHGTGESLTLKRDEAARSCDGVRVPTRERSPIGAIVGLAPLVTAK